MSCKACENIREVDGIALDCERCNIPALSPDEARILKMHRILVSLNGLVSAGAVLRTYGATKEDLEMLAVVEDELKAIGKNREACDANH